MRRRELFGRFAVVAVAVAVAPALTAEAAVEIVGKPLETVKNRRKPLSLTEFTVPGAHAMVMNASLTGDGDTVRSVRNYGTSLSVRTPGVLYPLDLES